MGDKWLRAILGRQGRQHNRASAVEMKRAIQSESKAEDIKRESSGKDSHSRMISKQSYSII